MHSQNLKTKIFLDSGDPAETREALSLLGFLDGQTTNPSLVAKSPEIAERFEKGEKLSEEELLSEYKRIVTDVADQIPEGSVSIEVYADAQTPTEKMIEQAKEFFSWIPNAHIKLPTTAAGLEAAEKLLTDNIRLNFTLVFTQRQAAAIHVLTKGVKKGDVFISPFEGRLVDQEKDGVDLVDNIMRMYKKTDSAVEVLAASIRELDYLMYAIYSEVDIITSPFKILKDWAEHGSPIPGVDIDRELFKDQNAFMKHVFNNPNVKDIEYEQIDLGKHWRDYDLGHELTDKGLEKFAADWNKLIS